MRESLFLAAAALVVVACASKAAEKPNARQSVGCAAGQTPCGNGCRPTGTVCCDDGTGVTSSYCGAGLGCFGNGKRGCTTGGAASTFCCGAAGVVGSVDCPAGQHHCGDACVPLDTVCCSGDACPSTTTSPTAACQTGLVLCGVCNTGAGGAGVCHACPSGSCCSNDVCSNICVKGDACTVPSAPATTCASSSDCGSGRVCASSRRCQAGDGGGACACNGDTTGTCIDFASRQLTVSACGSCTNDYSACCPGTMCVDGACKASCP